MTLNYTVRGISSQLTAFVAFLFFFLLFPSALFAGNGKMVNGVFDFCVSVRFNATETQLQAIRDRFARATDVLYSATDGQARFGNITIVNNSGASEIAEFWIEPGPGRAYVIGNGFGTRGAHITMY